MSTPSETSPLIKRSARRKCSKGPSSRFQYRLPKIKEKGAIIVIICNLLLLSAGFAQIQRNYMLKSAFSIALPLVFIIVFPIAGVVADLCTGRFKVIQASIVLLIISSLFNIISLCLQGYLPSTVQTVFVVLGEVLCCTGASCYLVCVFPFTADQLIGASGEQLSFAMYWIMWGFAIAVHTILLSYIPLDNFDIIAQAVSLLCVSAMAFIFWRWKGTLNTNHPLINPYKLIFKVLTYSWKHKYPERRSALTYWEEKYPSRIDLGMSKYGGPFTVEEVEDVKTFFRLLPVIFCAGGCCVGTCISWEKLLIAELLFSEKNARILACSDAIQLVLSVFGIPIYHLIIYPFFYNYVPTMLRRIGLGLFLILLSFLMFGTIGNVLLCNSDTNVTCLFLHSEDFNVSSDGLWWILLPSTAYNFGFLLSVITLFEFVFAQTPYSLQGLMTGLTILSLGLGLSFGYGVCKLVLVVFSSTHSWFISSISLFVVTALYLIFFVCFSKRYVLRKRDDIVPIHLFAEEYFEKELKGRTKFKNEKLHR